MRRNCPDGSTRHFPPKLGGHDRKEPGVHTRPLKMRRVLLSLIFGVFVLQGLRGAGPSIQFTDVTKSAGITFNHYTGAFGKKYLPETLGPGVAFIDYDGDGWQDLFFANGMDWPGQHR